MGRITPEGRFPVADLTTEAQRELDLRRQHYWRRVRAPPSHPASSPPQPEARAPKALSV